MAVAAIAAVRMLHACTQCSCYSTISLCSLNQSHVILNLLLLLHYYYHCYCSSSTTAPKDTRLSFDLTHPSLGSSSTAFNNSNTNNSTNNFSNVLSASTSAAQPGTAAAAAAAAAVNSASSSASGAVFEDYLGGEGDAYAVGGSEDITRVCERGDMYDDPAARDRDKQLLIPTQSRRSKTLVQAHAANYNTQCIDAVQSCGVAAAGLVLWYSYACSSTTRALPRRFSGALKRKTAAIKQGLAKTDNTSP
eukprot:8081-Heterococcus_DN1.PRE.4